MIVVASPEQAEALLDAGKLGCPGCAGALRPHGYGRIRRVRSLDGAPVTVRPRRARCFSCTATHVLLPAGLVLRRADTAQVIGTALAARPAATGTARSRPGWTARPPRCAAGCVGRGNLTSIGCTNRACSTRVPCRS